MPAAVSAPTDPRKLEEALARLREGAPRWARAPLPQRIARARAMMAGAHRTAERAVAAGAGGTKGARKGQAARRVKRVTSGGELIRTRTPELPMPRFTYS